MKKFINVKTFTDRYPLIGPLIWVLCIQYFLIQLVVAKSFTYHYSLSANTISDLGNTMCGRYGTRNVCSPLHPLMNASFILLGITMASGALFIYQEFKKNKATLIGFSFTALAGVGSILVGTFPENSVSPLHVLGASFPFIFGNIALIILSIDLDIPKFYRIYTFLSGAIALIASLLFLTHNYLGLGIGGMERFVAYPQTIWLIIFGVYISKTHISKVPLTKKTT